MLFQMTEVGPRTFVVQWTENDAVVHRLVKVQSKTELLEASLKAFSITEGTYALEMHYPEFDVFVRVDDYELLPESGRLRLIKIVKTLPSTDTAETAPVLTLDISNLGESDTTASSERPSIGPFSP